MSQLMYAKLYECDACGQTAEVRQPSTLRNISATPMPEGWSVGRVHVDLPDSGGVHRRRSLDICPACMSAPMDVVISLAMNRAEVSV